jgi:hypothetical protein
MATCSLEECEAIRFARKDLLKETGLLVDICDIIVQYETFTIDVFKKLKACFQKLGEEFDAKEALAKEYTRRDKFQPGRFWEILAHYQYEGTVQSVDGGPFSRRLLWTNNDVTLELTLVPIAKPTKPNGSEPTPPIEMYVHEFVLETLASAAGGIRRLRQLAKKWGYGEDTKLPWDMCQWTGGDAVANVLDPQGSVCKRHRRKLHQGFHSFCNMAKSLLKKLGDDLTCHLYSHRNQDFDEEFEFFWTPRYWLQDEEDADDNLALRIALFVEEPCRGG